MADKDANFVGIIVLKDTALDQPEIVRLEPLPGNAGILIRGGAGWVFDRVRTRPVVDPRIARQAETPTRDEVALALTRELAYRWFYCAVRLNVQARANRRGAEDAESERWRSERPTLSPRPLRLCGSLEPCMFNRTAQYSPFLADS